jgi:hypothetical protein
VVTPDAFVQALAAEGPQVRLVVLNACFTAPMAQALLVHADCVVGMSGAIHDDAARNFAIGFYGGLGERESIAAAFAQGTAAINLSGLPDADQPQLQVRDGFDASALILAAVEPVLLVKLPCPYPGMRPYQADDAEGFYGRDAEVDELIGRLRAGEREIYVIGPSGSGKSSLVAAGLLSQLARGVSGLGLFVVRTVRPGERPAARLCEALDAPGQPLVVADRIAALLAHRGSSSSVLFVVDQLEELFTLASADERETFLAALRALRAVPRCVVICTLRADFFGALIESSLWPEHRGRKQLSHIEVSPLRGEALREAIATPAHEIGVEVEPELVERLLADAASEPGILPLLQETLVQLWDKRTDQVLTLAHYLALGDGERSGLAIALARRADATLRRLNTSQTDIARRILLRLISFGEGRSDTRRQQPRAQLCAAGEDAAEFAHVLQTLVDDRLLTVDEGIAGEPRVDLAHEIMISAWPTLADWIRSHRVDEQRRRHFEEAAVQRSRGARGLLDPIELAEAENWQRTESAVQLGQSAQVTALIAASSGLRAMTHPRCARRGHLAQRPAQRRQDRLQLAQPTDHHPLYLGAQARHRALDQPGVQPGRARRQHGGIGDHRLARCHWRAHPSRCGRRTRPLGLGQGRSPRALVASGQQLIDQPGGLSRGQAVPRDHLRDLLLVAARQPADLPRRRRRDQSEPDVRGHALGQPLRQHQPATHPALVPP